MIKIPTNRKSETWIDPDLAKSQVLTWFASVSRVKIVTVECDGEKRYAVEAPNIKPNSGNAIYGRKGLNLEGQIWPEVEKDISIKAEHMLRTPYEMARRLIEMSLKLAQISNGQGALAAGDSVPPIKLFYAGSPEKVHQVEADLKKLDEQNHLQGYGEADEFISDFRMITRRKCPTVDSCVAMLYLFCQAYPSFTPSEFKLRDKSFRTFPIPQHGKQQQLDIVQNDTNRNKHTDGPTQSTPYGETIPFISQQGA